MAASALGFASATHFAASTDGGVLGASSASSSSASPSAGFITHTRQVFPSISSSPSWASACTRIRARCYPQANSEVAEPLSSPSPSSSSRSADPPIDPGPPTIDLEFLALEQGQDGLRKVDKISVESGEKLLRTIMNEQKLELYGLYGKIMNCGGGGSCGTCIVEVLEGSNLLNERTDAEERFLKKKPRTWRLACQTIVGDKTNAGKVVVQRLPQKKK